MFLDALSLSRTGRRDHPGGIVGLAAILLALAGLAACGPFADEPDQPDYWSPFHTQSNWRLEDGAIHVVLSGFERGHQPGRTSEFTLVVENRTPDDVAAPICLYLVDEYEIVQEIGDLAVDLTPGAAGVRPFPVAFDEDLAPRAYGLAILVDGMGAIVHTVRLGIADDEVRPWLDVGELTCDP